MTITKESIAGEVKYALAHAILSRLLEQKIISKPEFEKADRLNHESFKTTAKSLCLYS